jgi:hypothetical protein
MESSEKFAFHQVVDFQEFWVSSLVYRKGLRIVSSLGVCGSRFAMSVAVHLANVQWAHCPPAGFCRADPRVSICVPRWLPMIQWCCPGKIMGNCGFWGLSNLGFYCNCSLKYKTNAMKEHKRHRKGWKSGVLSKELQINWGSGKCEETVVPWKLITIATKTGIVSYLVHK